MRLPSGGVRCPSCLVADTRVVDSRTADEGAAIRRRRACSSCGARFTTFERLEERMVVVRKRSGARVPFESAKIVAGLTAAAKGRPVGDEDIAIIAAEIEAEARRCDQPMETEAIGLLVLDHLKRHDHVAYLRFASVYKSFAGTEDFARELALLEGDGRPSTPAPPG